MSLRQSSMTSLVAAFSADRDPSRPYVAVALDDNDNATVIGRYAKRSTAQAQATRAGNERLRSYVVARGARGVIVAMSGSYIMGTHDPASN